eukprot:scaffold3334_cov139-Isochrysis_galbana.AAC.6
MSISASSSDYIYIYSVELKMGAVFAVAAHARNLGVRGELARNGAQCTQSNPPPFRLQAGSCQVCRSTEGEGDRGLGEIGESEC